MLFKGILKTTHSKILTVSSTLFQRRGQDSNTHFDNSAIRTQVQCTRPLSHGTPIDWIPTHSLTTQNTSMMH